MKTFRNEKTGQELQSTLSKEEVLKTFGETASEDNWLWYWLHKFALSSLERKNNPSGERALAFLADSFVIAIGYGLKKPMIRAHYKDQRFKFYLSQKGTVCIKSGFLVAGDYNEAGQPTWTNDPLGDEFYIGCLLRGQFLPATEGYGTQGPKRNCTLTETEFLSKFRENPVEFLAQCSRDMGRCSYCNLPLEDPRSKKIGYGSTCAKRWGLPWGDDSYMEKAPSFAKNYNEQGAGLLAGLRSEPKNETRWHILADWLEENCLPRCEMPKGPVVLPRND